MSGPSGPSSAGAYAELLQHLGPIETSRYFGGTGLRKNGVLFALVMHGPLYLRVDDESRSEFEALGSEPFVYMGASGPVTVASYYQVPESVLNNVSALESWAERAYLIAKSASRRSPVRPRKTKRFT